MEGAIAVTYRCNSKCQICHSWMVDPSTSAEMDVMYYEHLPAMRMLSITGGEPFLRDDLEEIIRIVRPKCKRILITTNGYLTERIVALAKKYRDIAFRVSIEGLSLLNDELRGVRGGFDHALRTILMLKDEGVRDVGINTTVTDLNPKAVMELYALARHLGVEFATGIVHNGYAYHKNDNEITQRSEIIDVFEKLIAAQLHTMSPKDWFRAYINYGIINYVNEGKRLLPCTMGYDKFWCEPWGDIKPCNIMDDTMGNITEVDFTTIWQSKQSDEIRRKVAKCRRQCWLPYNAGQIMRRRIWVPVAWILRNKWREGAEARMKIPAP